MITKYIEFSMVDNINILDQAQELQLLGTKLRHLRIIISAPVQCSAIIAKLPPTWLAYLKKLQMIFFRENSKILMN